MQKGRHHATLWNWELGFIHAELLEIIGKGEKTAH